MRNLRFNLSFTARICAKIIRIRYDNNFLTSWHHPGLLLFGGRSWNKLFWFSVNFQNELDHSVIRRGWWMNLSVRYNDFKQQNFHTIKSSYMEEGEVEGWMQAAAGTPFVKDQGTQEGGHPMAVSHCENPSYCGHQSWKCSWFLAVNHLKRKHVHITASIWSRAAKSPYR